MEKFYFDDEYYYVPCDAVISLYSEDQTTEFLMDFAVLIGNKQRYQLRVYTNHVLIRIDVNSRPHRNPDRELIGGTHIHIYKEGYEDKFARPLPESIDENDIINILEHFME